MDVTQTLHRFRLAGLPPNFSSYLNLQHVTKWNEQLLCAEEAPNALRSQDKTMRDWHIRDEAARSVVAFVSVLAR